MSYIDELKAQRDEIDAKIKAAEKAEKEEKIEAAAKKLNDMTKAEKKAILKYMKHDRSSCDDQHIENGWSYHANTFRCRKCMLMELFNGEHTGFDFELEAVITEIK